MALAADAPSARGRPQLSEIGAALDMTKQGAFDYYRNGVDRQEQYAPQYSDIAAARKVQGHPDG